MKRVYCLLAICLCLLLAIGIAVADDKKLKAGFIYVGPVGDYGWSHAHDVGRKFAEEKLPWLETMYIESVGEADSARIKNNPLILRKIPFLSVKMLYTSGSILKLAK